jgi:hypothetical protein
MANTFYSIKWKYKIGSISRAIKTVIIAKTIKNKYNKKFCHEKYLSDQTNKSVIHNKINKQDETFLKF